MSAATDTKPTRWWSDVPNPPCQPWCTADHPADDFQRGSGMLCTRTVVKRDLFTVEVEQGQYGEEEAGVVLSEPAQIYVAVGRANEGHYGADVALVFARELLAAVEQAKRVIDNPTVVLT